ncbi:uncharacterized protein LOC117641804 [Thrips palmi]|uniref:Uncharacterized protein LOC117641804 n=1 Tax=Thrips palmi TaxID=161013 RepID=A0A6P8YFR7_THRPL|nr:uncharacterized protein LOC117641804 [Thrips palmi]
MFLEVPDVAALLAASAPPSSRCVGLEVRGETAAGENYGSTFLMLNAHFEDKQGNKSTVPAVCKRLPPTEYLRDTFNVDVSFPKEVDFYRYVVPAMEELQRDLRIPEAERFQSFPKMLGARIGSRDDAVVDDDAILVLEDLGSQGYRCGSRGNGMDVEQCRVAVTELARFHALGIALRSRRPAVFSGDAVQKACVFYMHNKREESDKLYLRFAENSLDMVLEHVPEVRSLVDEATLRKAMKTLKNDSLPAGPFTTILHEDFWVNNMMFAYDKQGKPDRLKMVDFQLTRIGPASSDLVFFLYSSADSDALSQVDTLLREYHAELVRYARLHGVDTSDMDWDAFQRDLATTVPVEFSHLFVMISIIRANQAVEKSDSHSDAVFSSKLGMSEAAKTRYVELLSHWVQRGWM